MKSLCSVLALAVAGLSVTGLAAPACAQDAAATPATVKTWLSQAEKDYFDQSIRTNRTEWVYQTNITYDTAELTSAGNAALTKLWNMGGNALEDIAQKQSEVVPGLSDYLAPVAEQMDPEAGIEEEYKVKNDKAFQWKALRLMAKKDVALLSKVSAPNGGLEAAVKHYFDQQGEGSAVKAEGDTEQTN